MATASTRCTSDSRSSPSKLGEDLRLLARPAAVGLEIAEAAAAVGDAADRIENGGDVAAAQLVGCRVRHQRSVAQIRAALGRAIHPQPVAGRAFEDDRVTRRLV